MLDIIDDTIVAIASPPGHGERGIVRLSGPATFELLASIFTPSDGRDVLSSCGMERASGLITIEDDCAIPGEAYLFRGPRSYTRQDAIEFHVPSSPALLGMLVEHLVKLGARQAQPGEFTARAFLNGRMDLSQAEAVAALIRSRSDGQLRAAQRMKEGRLARKTEQLLTSMAELVALVEADIDFAEEPIEFITPNELRERVFVLADGLRQLLSAAESSERIEVLPRILLVGRSNAGKSTLMNRLTGIDRAICSPIAGTTRDLLTAPVNLGGCEALLMDAAGVDPTMPELMSLAAEATRAESARVDLVCQVVDLSADPVDALRAFPMPEDGVRCVTVGNKLDLLSREAIRDARTSLREVCAGPSCLISAATGGGMDDLRRMLAEALTMSAHDADGGDAILINARQREAIESSLAALTRCQSETESIESIVDRADILAFELREALESLGSVAGAITTEDLLGRVFANFCIGK